jgi:uncharacterized protein YfaP (DUF2135 family)
MTMQYDVKSNHLNTSGVIYAGRTRVKGYQIGPTAAGQIDFYDNATTNSGSILMSVDTTRTPQLFQQSFPVKGFYLKTVYMLCFHQA